MQPTEPKRPRGRPPVAPEARSDAKPRSVRLSESRWAKLKSLGTAWLERQIDRAKLPD